ncbi:MAG: HAD-IIB family hydrolase [Nitrospira sp.]|jgi:mannosyl-3-phosphoglycerate phosphatase|nr:HAD-IIB family hydrolase [Nitrospira sp.]MDH4245857.1 HAD-IIB family hydrolase [Nitrospira sp.]MDH4354798.1 HAD-IIB family hydrolase [Nitrospira sp.]MDH5316721.1 HAD-IIB family hydrolase [Nitrospira sp.]
MMIRSDASTIKGDSMTMIIFTDLDGTLLDSSTYSFEAAREALDHLLTRSIPLVVVSSKTQAEIEPLRTRLGNEHPFIVENGGAVVIPSSYFPFQLPAATSHDQYVLVELGTSYAVLRQALKEIEQELGVELRGYGDMSLDEVVRRTGLSRPEAQLAMQRHYDEPFVVEDEQCPLETLTHAITARGLRWTKGDRFHHLMGVQDKGQAVHYLIDCYRRLADHDRDRLITVGIGNSLNDLPMLQAVEQPILVQQSNGLYETAISLPKLVLAPGPGPLGWNRAVLSLLG